MPFMLAKTPGWHDVVVAGQHDRQIAREQAGGMDKQALKPCDLVVELWPRLRIAVRQVEAANQNTRHRGLNVASLLICRVTQQGVTGQDRICVARQDRYAVTCPKNPLCLGLYNPWTENWYTNNSIRWHLPRDGRHLGHAVTCVFGLPDRNLTGRLSFTDVVNTLDAMQHPAILVIQQKWPADLMTRAGLAEEIMVMSMKAVGCVGLLSNGTSHDVDAVRRLNFQMLLGGVTAGHGEMAVHAVNVPVSVGDMAGQCAENA